MRVRDAAGQPLPYVRLWSELSIFFMAGMETTAHAITWALCALVHSHASSLYTCFLGPLCCGVST